MPEKLLPLFLFSLAGAATPGPNNIMVTASGQAFGLYRTLPHIFGVAIGFALLLIAFGLGLSQVFHRYPDLHRALRIAGAVYLLYLAWRIATTGDPANGEARSRPLSFFEAALFQWVNVKGLTFAAGVMTAFTSPGGNLLNELALIVIVFAGFTIPSLTVWCLFGVAISLVLKSDRARRTFNYAMGGLLALSVVLLFV
jgi:threonine/homoserine/homoserine lactone efflux protein